MAYLASLPEQASGKAIAPLYYSLVAVTVPFTGCCDCMIVWWLRCDYIIYWWLRLCPTHICPITGKTLPHDCRTEESASRFMR